MEGGNRSFPLALFLVQIGKRQRAFLSLLSLHRSLCIHAFALDLSCPIC